MQCSEISALPKQSFFAYWLSRHEIRVDLPIDFLEAIFNLK